MRCRLFVKGPVIQATFLFNFQCSIVALQVEKRCSTYYHPTQPLLCNKILKKVDASSTCCNMLFQLAITNVFEVGGNTCNNAFQLAMQQCCVQVEAICCSYYFTFRYIIKEWVYTVNISNFFENLAASLCFIHYFICSLRKIFKALKRK